MRLTDRPRTLIEMHPHVEWPQALQNVLDSALARSAKDRTTSASTFGRDFATAVLEMQDAHITEAGTQVIGAPVVPPTRVASAAPPGSAAATVKQGAVAAPPAAGAKSKTPMFAGIGAVVLAAAAVGGYFAFGNKGGTPPVTDSTAPQSQQATPSGTKADAVPSGTKADVQTPARPNPTSPGTKTAAVPAAETTEQRLDRIEALTDPTKSPTEDQLREALKLTSDLPSGGTDRARALLYRAHAYLGLGDTDGACRTLPTAKTVAAGTNVERAVNALADVVTCP